MSVQLIGPHIFHTNKYCRVHKTEIQKSLRDLNLLGERKIK